MKTGTRVHSDVPPEQEQNEETGTRAHSPKPPFYETAVSSEISWPPELRWAKQRPQNYHITWCQKVLVWKAPRRDVTISWRLFWHSVADKDHITWWMLPADPNPPEFAQPHWVGRNDRDQTHPNCTASHQGKISFEPSRFGWLPFWPTQTGLCKFGWVWS